MSQRWSRYGSAAKPIFSWEELFNMDNAVITILGAALVVGGIVAYRESPLVYVRAPGAAATTAGAIMFFIGLVNALSGTG